MIRSRMQAATEHLLAKSQYGFRPHISTSHAIYILRRIQDYAEIKGTQLNIAFLDWEKALGKIQHNKLLVALKRLGFSQKYLGVIKTATETRSSLPKMSTEYRTSRFNQLVSGKDALYRHICSFWFWHV
jgi:hypothetical protein